MRVMLRMFRSNRTFGSLAVLLASIGPSGGGSFAAEKVDIHQSDLNRTMDCGGGPLSVGGNGNHLVLTNCPDVTILGDHNNLSITFRMPGHVSITGGSNTVTWRNRPGIPTVINDSGKSNRVERVAYE
jgi:hypothetical protein